MMRLSLVLGVLTLLSLFYLSNKVTAAANESAFDNVTAECTIDHRPVLHLLSLLPYPDPEGSQPSWTEGPTLFIAEQLAVDLINNRSDILPDYRLELIRGDSGCNIKSKAVISLGEHILTDSSIAGIVGPGCSTSTLIVAPLISRHQIGLVTVHVAGSLLLSDRELYSNSFGTLDSTEVFVQTLVTLSKRNNWQNVSVFYDEQRLYYYTTQIALNSIIRTLNGSLNIVSSSALYDTFIPTEIIQASGSRVIFLLVGPDFLSRIFCLGFYNGLLFDTYQWVVVSRTLDEISAITFIYNGQTYSCDEEQMKTATNKTIFMHYRLDPIDVGEITHSGLTYSQFLDMYTERATLAEFEPSFWAPSFFDAVWSLALALNNSREEMKEITGLDLSEYRYGHRNGTDIVRKNLLQLDFSGVSGRIEFDSTSGYVNRAVDIYQVINNTMKLVEYFDGNDIVQVADSPLEYISSSYSLTLASTPFVFGILFMIIVVAGLVLLIASQTLIIVYRNHHSVKAVSPKLLHVAFIGCYFLNFTCFFYIIVEGFTIPDEAKCALYQILNITAMLGTTLVFGSISAKTWRLYRIFVHYLDPGRFISDTALFTYIVILMLIQVPAMIAWTVIEPQTPFIYVFMDEGLFRSRCVTPNYTLWFGSVFIYNTGIILISLFLALLCHRIPQRDFKTNSIVVLVYLLTIDLIVGFPVYFALPVSSDVTPEFIVLNFTLILVFYLCLFLLFLSPLWPIFKEKLSPHFSKNKFESEPTVYGNTMVESSI